MSKYLCIHNDEAVICSYSYRPRAVAIGHGRRRVPAACSAGSGPGSPLPPGHDSVLPFEMVVTVRPLAGLAFGAEVHGVDLRQGCHSAADAAAIVAAWHAHGLLVFRRQTLAPEDEIALAKRFPFDERLDGASLKPWVPPGSEYSSLRRSVLTSTPELELKGLVRQNPHHNFQFPQISCRLTGCVRLQGSLDGHLGLDGDLFESNPLAEWVRPSTIA